eukprot:304192_1
MCKARNVIEKTFGIFFVDKFPRLGNWQGIGDHKFDDWSRTTVAAIAIISTAFTISRALSSDLSEHPLENERTYHALESGVYRCFMPDEGVSFNVYCMVDGTMYINPTQQALYPYQ